MPLASESYRMICCGAMYNTHFMGRSKKCDRRQRMVYVNHGVDQNVLGTKSFNANLIVSRSHRRFAMSYSGYQFTTRSSTNYASLCSKSNANTSRPQHTCRHSVCHSQLSQPVVSCRQQPEATSTSGEHELPRTAHGHSQFLDLHVGIHYRHL